MHKLPALTYEYEELEPHIDAQTMEIHYSKHHQKYVDNLNDALKDYPELQEKTVEELLIDLNSLPEEIRIKVRNNGGGHANHSLFWQTLSRGKDNNEPSDSIGEKIKSDFGSFISFKENLTATAVGIFGSGWAWLVLSGDKLEIIKTANQDSPLMDGKTPLFGIDVWEHAYYLKYQNKRPEYIENIFKLINWSKVNEIFENIK